MDIVNNILKLVMQTIQRFGK